MYTVIQNGDQVTVPVYARNNGTGIETNAMVTINIPTGMSLVSATPNKGTFTNPIWNVGSLNPGEEFRMDVVLEVDDLSEAPFLFTYSIGGESIDGVGGNNSKTITIEAVSDLFTATANDDSNLSMSFDLSQNDIPCNYCDTKWTITAPSVINGTIISFDQSTGKGEFRFNNPTLDGSFQYTISCYNCGDGVTYDQDTAMATFPALFDGTWIPAIGGDVSTMTNDPDGTNTDLYRHSAGGVDTDLDLGQYKIVGGVWESNNDNKLTLELKNAPSVEIDLTSLVSHARIQNLYLSGNTLHIVEGSGILSNNRSIDLTPILPTDTNTVNASLSLSGNSLVLTDSEANTVTEDLSSIIVTGISVDETAAPTKVITLTFADASTVTASFTDDTSSGGGDNWGTQVAQTDVTLSGDGTGGSPLSVSTANNPMVDSFIINGTNDLVLTLTDGTVITLTNAAMKSAFNTDETVLTDVTLVGNELRITDDAGVKSVDLTPLITTTLAWGSITAKPTLIENGGNVTGFINLDTEQFALTAPDTNTTELTNVTFNSVTNELTVVDDNQTWTIDLSSLSGSGADGNSYVTGATLLGSILTISRNDGLPDIDIDLSTIPVTNTSLSISNVGELVTITVTDSDGGTVSQSFNFCDTCDPIDWTDIANKPTLTEGVGGTPGDGNVKGSIPLTGSTFDLETDVNSNNTLSGTGSPTSPLAVDPANNPMVDTFEIDLSENIVLTLTDGTVLTLTKAAIQSAFDTNTDTTVLTSATLVGNELRITDDAGVKAVDLTPLITTTLAWGSVTSKPTLSQNGGNVTGSIDLDTGNFSLTYTDNDTNNYVTAGSIPIPSNGQLVLERAGASDVLVDLSSLQNTEERFALSQTVIDFGTAIGSADNILNNSAVVVPYDGDIISFSFSFVNFEGTGVINLGGLPAGDVGDKRVNFILNSYQSGRDITNSADSVEAYVLVQDGHRKEVRLQSPLGVQAGDIVRFELVDSNGDPIVGSLLTEGFITTVHMTIDEVNNSTNTASATIVV